MAGGLGDLLGFSFFFNFTPSNLAKLTQIHSVFSWIQIRRSQTQRLGVGRLSVSALVLSHGTYAMQLSWAGELEIQMETFGGVHLCQLQTPLLSPSKGLAKTHCVGFTSCKNWWLVLKLEKSTLKTNVPVGCKIPPINYLVLIPTPH